MKQDKPIIRTLMDTDRYKLSMQKAFLHNHPGAYARYRFKCRSEGVNIGRYVDEIREEIKSLDSLTFTQEELDYIKKIPSLSGDYIDFLRIFRLDSRMVSVENTNGTLMIEAEGPIVHAMPFELYILPIVQEVFFRNEYPDLDYSEGKRRLEAKIDYLKNTEGLEGFRYADFGGRRRASRKWHDYTVKRQAETLGNRFNGTSNMWLAMKYNLTPIGTMAHEYLQAFQALGPRLVDSQKAALEAWVKEFRGDLGIALTDVVGMDAFLRDMDLYFAKLFDGFRHDSGCPYEWTRKLVNRLKELKIDPRTKTAVYSDSLTMEKAAALYLAVKDAIIPVFGIGTHLTNDCGPSPLNLVMKMVECNGQPVAKVSDSKGKGMCDNPEYLNYLMHVFQIMQAE
ncbi:MAG: nicotinate phosphoribosyltransferase [Desulfobacteraceae bacterium]|jgi:nicotinate phosphoribosyltransferase